MDQHIEVSAILLCNSYDKIYILSIYRAPCGNFTVFLEKLETILNLIFRNNAKTVLCGDINVNCLTNNNKKRKMDLILASFNLVSTVNFPTRLQNNSATAMDNIFIDASLQGNYVYLLCNGLSDLDAQLIVLTEVKAFTRNVAIKKKQIIRKIDHTAAQDFQYKLSFVS
jgi:hypothetical protein